MTFHETLKKIRLERGMTQQQIADLMQIDKSTYCGYETGKRQPDVLKIKQIANILDVSADALLDTGFVVAFKTTADENLLKKYRALDAHGMKIINYILDEEYERCIATVPAATVRLIPFSLLPASAGFGEWLDDENWDEMEILDTRDTGGADFAIKVSGDSMEPTFHDGEVVLVRKQDVINVGDIGIFIVDGRGYIKEQGEDCLLSHNPAYENIYPTADMYYRCCGKVIGKI